NPKETTQEPEDKELWSDEMKRVVAETSTKKATNAMKNQQIYQNR
ncbi:8947_t:CDS:1, partial [Acaulospora morrowiae]